MPDSQTKQNLTFPRKVVATSFHESHSWSSQTIKGVEPKEEIRVQISSKPESTKDEGIHSYTLFSIRESQAKLTRSQFGVTVLKFENSLIA